MKKVFWFLISIFLILLIVFVKYPPKLSLSTNSNQNFSFRKKVEFTSNLDFFTNLFSSFKKSDDNYSNKLKIGEKEILVEIANTPEKQKQGLSGREKFEDGNGMLFVYDKPQLVVFWMPDMNFSIDIIFIKENKIVEILDSVQNYPKDYPREKLPRYQSKAEVDMVLEVPASWSEENEIGIGDEVKLM